jgi:hypothetical protein
MAQPMPAALTQVKTAAVTYRQFDRKTGFP